MTACCPPRMSAANYCIATCVTQLLCWPVNTCIYVLRETLMKLDNFLRCIGLDGQPCDSGKFHQHKIVDMANPVVYK